MLSEYCFYEPSCFMNITSSLYLSFFLLAYLLFPQAFFSFLFKYSFLFLSVLWFLQLYGIKLIVYSCRRLESWLKALSICQFQVLVWNDMAELFVVYWEIIEILSLALFMHCDPQRRDLPTLPRRSRPDCWYFGINCCKSTYSDMS